MGFSESPREQISRWTWDAVATDTGPVANGGARPSPRQLRAAFPDALRIGAHPRPGAFENADES